jgi:hypothetical protein
MIKLSTEAFLAAALPALPVRTFFGLGLVGRAGGLRAPGNGLCRKPGWLIPDKIIFGPIRIDL